MVFYESPFRLVKLLGECLEHFGPERHVSVTREISKVYEETIRGTVEEVKNHFEQKGVKGEIVLVLGHCYDVSRTDR